MPTLELTEQEWQNLSVMLTKQPWEVANPILYKMAQMSTALARNEQKAWTMPPPRPDGSGTQSRDE